MKLKLIVAMSTCALLLSGAAGRLGTAPSAQTPQPPTFSDTIAPIVHANCVSCHRPGEAAPFSLISYEDVAKRGALIAAVTQARIMPPWRAEPGYGEFLDERRLTDAQIAAIGEWVKRGMPVGDRSRIPAPPAFTDGWRLGTPDLVLEMPAGFEVPASGPDIYRNFPIPTRLTEEKWIRAIEFRPSARSVVHHAIFSFVRGNALADFVTADGKPGFNGGMPLGLVPGLQPSGQLGAWAVGMTPRSLPMNQAWTMAAGSDFVLQLHFHPSGKPEIERSRVGLYFADQAPDRRLRNMGAIPLAGVLADIDIPPGVKDYTVNGSLTLRGDMLALSVMAHAHYLGKEVKATAFLPDGTTRPMLWIRNWNFNWQDRYFYKEPVLLPRGTRIDVSISYDNSAENPQNPNSPPQRVQWGVQSTDEMGAVDFQMVVANPAEDGAFQQITAEALRSALQRALQSGALQRYQQQLQRAREAAGK